MVVDVVQMYHAWAFPLKEVVLCEKSMVPGGSSRDIHASMRSPLAIRSMHATYICASLPEPCRDTMDSFYTSVLKHNLYSAMLGTTYKRHYVSKSRVLRTLSFM